VMGARAHKDADAFRKEADAYLELFDDLDRLLATRGEFLLGRWIEDAKRWGSDDAERALLEWNARTQVTLWGPPDGVLHDYAQKQWAGLVKGFYRPRWEQFLAQLEHTLRDGRQFDVKAFTEHLQQWEDAWTHRTDPHPSAPSGNPVEVSLELWEKYHAEAS
ncbi:MAG TPA: alpha-N-acetylglucosaminidase C-terminal domain-containing protein, partial [Candidatus Hydrogenedentes bacterium]|nr:alpha-N-acetylglucosaminidase C-terminal domain-containing protein [Candidatus Hydrogenedentota bacterium]